MKRILLLLCATSLLIQDLSAQQIADDPSIRKGHLENGMTYYIAHNANPAGCAEFFIAHNVGALQEEDNQNGLAHFLEHMAFNGTKHYPNKDLLNFLAKEGVRFGYNVNAYTSRNETVYNVSAVPLVRESFIDSVLLILHDWSCDISCEQAALDEERGVISEEWRLRDEPRYRMTCRQNDLVYRGGKHPKRTVLGTYEVINGFKREEILDFYHKWYRPDLQAIIVVGDFDVDQMEAKVRKAFSDIPAVENPRQKEASYKPGKRTEPIIEDMTDKVITYKAYKILYKQDFPAAEVRSDEMFLRDKFARDIVSSVMGARLSEKTKVKTCPYQSAAFVTSNSESDYYTTLITISARGDDMAPSVEAVLTEIERMKRFGISKDEFEVAKLEVCTKAHLNKVLTSADVKSEDYVKRCIENFLRNYPCVTPQQWQSIRNKVLSELSYEFVAPYTLSMFNDAEEIYSNCRNEKETKGIVSKESLLAILDKVEKMELEPQYLEYPELDLTIAAKPGSIVKEKSLRNGELQQWTLSNGVTVYFRPVPTVQSNNHISMAAYFDTGFRVLPEDQLRAGLVASAYIRRNLGFKQYDFSAIKNYPELSNISMLSSYGANMAKMSLSASADKAENAFKTFHLLITEPYFGKSLDKYKGLLLKNLGKKQNPRMLFKKKSNDVYYEYNPLRMQEDSAAVNGVSKELVEKFYKAAFSGTDKVKLFICSDIETAKIKDWVCRYVASLPETPRDPAVGKSKCKPTWQAYKGHVKIEETNAPQSAPVCEISRYFSKNLDNKTRTIVEAAVLDYVLSSRYLNRIREERGGTYHVSFSTEVSENPKHPAESNISFQTRPEMCDILLQDVEDIMQAMCKQGPTEEELATAVKYLKKASAEKKIRTKNNIQTLCEQLADYIRYDLEYDADFASILDSIKPADIARMARKITSGDQYLEIYTEK